MSDNQKNCQLCLNTGGTLVWQDDKLRIIHTPELGLPAFFRVVWNQHVAELSGLSKADIYYCLDKVVLVERILREVLSPTKVNIASLGNMVPHLHWHVIARFEWDRYFPDAVWAAPSRDVDTVKISHIESSLPLVKQNILAALG